MQLEWSYLGDAPSLGFATVRQVTNEFPAGARWADSMKVVRLNNVEPVAAGKPDGLNEVTFSYELQSLQYGRLCAVFSNSVCAIAGGELAQRQHSYTQVVAFPNKAGCTAAESHAINQLLAFDEFLTKEEFWQMDKSFTLEPIQWEPPQAAACEKPAQLNDMQLALLCRYWRTASSRAFSLDNQPLECVCVAPAGVATEAEAIEQAKKLCSGLLIPCLPKAVSNITSISAGARVDMLGFYQPTALAVVVAGDEMPAGQRYFDMRSNAFQPLTQNELDFIRAVTGGVTSPGLEEMYNCYCAENGSVTREACSFMADYHVAFTAWYLENGRHNGSSQDAVSCLRSLSNMLQTVHHLSQNLADNMLAPLEAVVFGSGLKQEVMSADNFKYLLAQVTRAPQNVALEQMKLLALHEKHRQEPSFLKAWPVSNPNHQRLGEVMEHILLNAYIDPPINEKERDDLNKPSFIKYCKEREPVAAAMASYLRAYTDRYPEQGLFVLPLTKQFLEGRDMLSQSLKLLISGYTEQLPGKDLLDGVKSAEQYLDEGNQALLAQYYLECFRKHRAASAAIKPVVAGIGADTTQGFCLVLQDEARRAGTQEPLAKEQVKGLLDAFGAGCKNPGAVRAEYAAMLAAVLEESVTSGVDRFQWFCQAGDVPQLMEAKEAHRVGVDYLCRLALHTGRAADDQNFYTAIGWLKIDGITEDQKRSMNTMLDTLQPQTRDQANRTFGMFGSVETYPNLRKVLLESVRGLLVKKWNDTGRYWDSIREITDPMRLGNLTLKEVGEGDERVITHGTNLLTRHMSTAGNQEHFRLLIEEGASKPDSPFKVLWNQQLRVAYCMKYDQLFEACANIEEVKRLRLQTMNLNLVNDVQGKEGFLNARLALEAEDLLVSRARGQINNERFYHETVRLNRSINQQRPTQTFHTLRSILMTTAEQYANGQFFDRLLVYLLPADTMEPKDGAVYLMERMLVWNDEVIRKPWAEENLQQLQNVANMIKTLSWTDGNRPQLAQTFVDTLIYTEPYLQYTDRIRKNRKNILTYFPAMGEGGAAYGCAIAPELRRWLGGTR